MMKKWRLSFLILTGILSSCVYDNLNTVAVCNLENISYSKQVQPIITARCATASCHSPARASSLLTLHNYEEIFRDSTDVRRYVINKKMPVGTPLTDCELNTIVKWLDQGGSNN